MIIFDLDGTLADCEHRRHFVDPEIDKSNVFEFDEYDNHGMPLTEKGAWHTKDAKLWKPDWKAFFETCDKDRPIKETICIFGQLCSTSFDEISIWSGRCESVREKTMKWLHEHVPRSSWIKELKMRPIGDNTPDDILKEKWLDETYEETKWGSKTSIKYVFDDRPKVIRMWRRRGIFVFNCCQHDEEF